jgi:hypothetical protein
MLGDLKRQLNGYAFERTMEEEIVYYLKVIFRFLLLPMARHPLVGLGSLICNAWRSNSDTLHSVGLLWTRDQPAADTSN